MSPHHTNRILDILALMLAPWAILVWVLRLFGWLP